MQRGLLDKTFLGLRTILLKKNQEKSIKSWNIWSMFFFLSSIFLSLNFCHPREFSIKIVWKPEYLSHWFMLVSAFSLYTYTVISISIPDYIGLSFLNIVWGFVFDMPLSLLISWSHFSIFDLILSVCDPGYQIVFFYLILCVSVRPMAKL